MDIRIIQQMLQNQAMSILNRDDGDSRFASQFPALFQDILSNQVSGQHSASDRRNRPLYPVQHENRLSMTTLGYSPSSGKGLGTFDTYIENSSQKYGVDKALIHADINAESSYNPNALSSADRKSVV